MQFMFISQFLPVIDECCWWSMVFLLFFFFLINVSTSLWRCKNENIFFKGKVGILLSQIGLK